MKQTAARRSRAPISTSRTSTLFLPACALLLLALAGCESRSISDSGYRRGGFGRADSGSYTYRGELTESDVIGTVTPTGPITDADIQRALNHSRPVHAAPGTGLVVVQSGAVTPDDAMLTALDRRYHVQILLRRPARRGRPRGLLQAPAPRRRAGWFPAHPLLLGHAGIRPRGSGHQDALLGAHRGQLPAGRNPEDAPEPPRGAHRRGDGPLVELYGQTGGGRSPQRRGRPPLQRPEAGRQAQVGRPTRASWTSSSPGRVERPSSCHFWRRSSVPPIFEALNVSVCKPAGGLCRHPLVIIVQYLLPYWIIVGPGPAQTRIWSSNSVDLLLRPEVTCTSRCRVVSRWGTAWRQRERGSAAARPLAWTFASSARVSDGQASSSISVMTEMPYSPGGSGTCNLPPSRYSTTFVSSGPVTPIPRALRSATRVGLRTSRGCRSIP